jgi:MoCo/4Fe-4S cofactor protein with predicted Tat translocation signal
VSSIKHHVTGMQYWRSLEQLADGPEMRELIDKEFPGYDPENIQASSRRSFLKIMSASLALAGVTLTGCRRWPKERLAPYSSNPRDRMPGVPEQFATVWELAGVAMGLLVTSVDGRPIKIEGNPSHPFAWTVKDKIGSADTFAQASVLELYDPQRSRAVIDRTSGNGFSRYTDWANFGTVSDKIFKKGSGDGFAILSEASSSPSVLDMKKRLLAAYPGAQWYEYEPLTHDSEREGTKQAFGKPVRPRLFLEKAQTIVCLDADLLGTHPAHTRYANDWSQGRRSADAPEKDKKRMSRVFVAESAFTITGSVADVRIGVDPSRIDAIARALARSVGVEGVTGDERLSPTEAKFVTDAVKDLQEAREAKAAVVAVGPSAPAHVHTLVCAINEKLNAVGGTIAYFDEPAGDQPAHMKQIADLSDAMRGDKVQTLLILGGNPVYDAPADVKFADAMAKVPNTIRLGLYDDETSAKCKWHLPRAHYLESWGDARAWDGTPSITQPLIEPLYGGKSIIEVLALIVEDSVTVGEQLVRRTWKQFITGEFEPTWRAALEAGVLADATPKAADVKVQSLNLPATGGKLQGFALRFQPDPRTYDGRFANNGWLQETPDPISKMVWDNAAMISKPDADKLGLTTGDMIRLTTAHASLDVAAYVLPGQPLGVIGVTLGYGRTAAGHIGNGLGFQTYALRTSHTPYFATGMQVSKTGDSYILGLTQNHHLIDAIGQEGRDKRIGPKGKSSIVFNIIHESSFVEFKDNPHSAHTDEVGRIGLQLFQPPMKFADTHAWGMSIDLNTCIGCHACAVACQAENNIPIVGKEQVLNHREMNWIRVDRYFKGNPDDSNDIEVVWQPMTCQHCENAPCEQVCPVAATVHDSEGLNTMVYNRCIGTRYCSNNCPYKVRRFNYFDYHSQDPRQSWGKPYPKLPDMQQEEQVDSIKRMVFNPEVTVRMRGVMEKCTYCVQRIHHATIEKRAAGTDVKDGDIITACQQACPTNAIVFGNLLEPDAQVTRMHKNVRSYAVLDEELNTKPRTLYMAKIRNPADEAGAEKKA